MSDPNKVREMSKIVALMDNIGNVLLPSTKFNHIQGVNRHDVYEFKSKSLRVYVVKFPGDIFIVIGGLKVNQKKDIE